MSLLEDNYESHSVNKLQSSFILLVLQIWKNPDTHFLKSFIFNISTSYF